MYENIRNTILKETGRESQITDREIDIIRKDSGRKEVERITYCRAKSKFERLISEFGEFYFCRYGNLLKLKIERQMVIRFIYLCTFANYDGKIEYGSAKGDGKLARLKDLQEILGLSRRETMYTQKVLIENKLILVNEDKTISISPQYAIKGKVKRRKALEKSVRVFEEGMQQLYKMAKPTEHKKLAILIELLPHINYDHNVVCFNPAERELSNIERMTLKDICVAIGYDETNSSRLKRELLRMKVGGKPVVMISLVENKHCVFINPQIYYKGHNDESLEHLMGIFKMFEKK